MNTKPFEQLGMTKNEAESYVGLIKIGAQTAGALSKNIKINRTTLYGILKSLVKKGFATTFTSELGVTYYKAVELEKLMYVAEKKEEEIQNIKKSIKNAITEAKIFAQYDTLPEISYFEGLKGLKSLYIDTAENNKEKQIISITDYEAGYKALGDFAEDYYKLRLKNKVHVLSMLPDSPMGRWDLKRTKVLLRQMKFIPIVEKLKIEINVYDDKVAIASFNPEQLHGILIKSSTIAQAMKNIFKYIWKK